MAFPSALPDPNPDPGGRPPRPVSGLEADQHVPSVTTLLGGPSRSVFKFTKQSVLVNSRVLIAVIVYACGVPTLWTETIEDHRLAVGDAILDTTATLGLRNTGWARYDVLISPPYRHRPAPTCTSTFPDVARSSPPARASPQKKRFSPRTSPSSRRSRPGSGAKRNSTRCSRLRVHHLSRPGTE